MVDPGLAGAGNSTDSSGDTDAADQDKAGGGDGDRSETQPERPAGAGLDPGAGAGGTPDRRRPSDQRLYEAAEEADTNSGSGGEGSETQPERPAGAGLDPGAGAGGTPDRRRPSDRQLYEAAGEADASSGGDVVADQASSSIDADAASSRLDATQAETPDRPVFDDDPIGRETQTSGETDSDQLGGVYGSEAERRRAKRVADQTELSLADIASVERSDDQLQPQLTGRARQERVAAQTPLAVGDISRVKRTDDGRLNPILTDSAEKRRAQQAIAEQNENISRSDIRDVERTDSGEFRPVLTDSAEERRARQAILKQNENIDRSDIKDVERTDSGEYRPVFTDEFRREQARQTAAEDNPLRDPGDFVATVEDDKLNVRKRQAPLFEDFRKRVGGDPPDESPALREVQKASKTVEDGISTLIEIEGQQNPISSQPVEYADGREVDLAASDRGFTKGFGAALNIPGAALDARTAGQQATELVQAQIADSPPTTSIDAGLDTDTNANVAPSDPPETEAVLGRNAAAVEQTAADVKKSAKQRPSETIGVLGGAAAAAVLTAGSSGIAVPRAARRGIGRVRTAGSQRLELSDVTQDSTARYFDPETPDQSSDARFPGATDQQAIQNDPADAIRRQSKENDPEALRERFDEAGVQETEETADMFKTIETEADSSRRGVGGFRSPDVEARDAADTYEIESGTFFGPDLSPAFLRTNFGDPEVGLRPGVPTLGDRPTAFAARGRVQEPEADDLRGLEQELQSADDPVLRTKPVDEVNPNEAEAVLPEGTELVDVGNRGLVESAARRVGIGSDFRIEVGNRRIPLRPVADPDLTDGGGSRLQRLLDDDRGQAGAGSADGGDLIGPRRFRVDSRASASGAVDRPAPIAGVPADSPDSEIGSAASSPQSAPAGSSGDSVTSVSSRSTIRRSPNGASRSGFSSNSGSQGGGRAGGSSPLTAGLGATTSAGVSPVPSGASTVPTSTSSVPTGTSNVPAGAPGTPTVPPGPPTVPPGTPDIPTGPPNTPRVPFDRENDTDDDDRERRPLFGGAREGVFVDFGDPLSGELLETQRDDIPTKPNEPVFLGFLEDKR